MPSSKSKSRKRRSRSGVAQRLMSHFLKIIISPIVIFWDVFRRKGSLDHSWTFSLLLLMTLLLGLVMISFLVIEGPVDRTLAFLVNANAYPEKLAGDIQPAIRYINKYALESKIDPHLIFAIVKTESNFNPRAISKSGARGLMQIMPSVWREYSHSKCSGRHSNQKECSENCIFGVGSNIRVGVKYFNGLLHRYHGRVDLALEAYNAGLANVSPGNEPKYAETRGYIQKTLSYWQELRDKTIRARLHAALYLKHGLKWLLAAVFGLWLLFFWWANRKLLPN